MKHNFYEVRYEMSMVGCCAFLFLAGRMGVRTGKQQVCSTIKQRKLPK